MNKTYSPEDLHFHAGVIYINGAGRTLRGDSPDGHGHRAMWYERADGIDLHQLLFCKKPESNAIRRHVLRCCLEPTTKVITLQDVMEIAAFVFGLDVSQVSARCWSVNSASRRWHVEIENTNNKEILVSICKSTNRDFYDVQSCLEFLYMRLVAEIKQKQEEIRKFLAICPINKEVGETNE